ncbi:MAG TPA: M1 family metallopeptidase [Clostridia bacterium]|nr:M1 family metallopeptidase [Clostridia bacterium]
MIRRARLTAVFILIVAMFVTITGGCDYKRQEEPKAPVPVNVPAQAESKADQNEYKINAVLDPVNNTLTAEQQVTYLNNEGVELSELYFHVYTNAFKKKETAPFLFDDFARAYSRGFQPGYTELTAVELSKDQERATLQYSLQGEGETILRVVLPELLKPRQKVVLQFTYKVIIPPAGERFGYGEKNINMGNWYPVAAVYDDEGWNLDKYYSVGDPFYSDASDYDVTIKAPAAYTIAASGTLTGEKAEGDSKSWSFSAESMRDFAFIASDEFLVAEGKAGNTTVKSYFYKGHENKGKEALDYGIRSIEVFSSSFGQYPYPAYSVVETEFPSGMEYPGLVYINTSYYDDNYQGDSLMFTTVHETAHQWWYGVVGNDQIDEAWLDEGFATYSEGIFTEKEFGRGNGELYFEYLEDAAKEDIEAKAYDGVILKSLDKYKNWDDYGPAVYTGGAVLLNEIRKQVGDKTFFNIMQSYYQEYSFKNATTEDFLQVCEEVSGKDFDELFDRHLSSVK